MIIRHHKLFGRRTFLAGTTAVAAGLTLKPFRSFATGEKKLNFYNWDTYIGETTLDDFHETTGIKTTMDLFADNDELFAKFREGNPGYDVIVPTSDYVDRMIITDMLAPLDHDKIPNIANIEKRFLDANFDHGRKFSLPYMWGVLVLGYRKSKVSREDANTWGTIYDSDRYAGRIALLGDAQNVIGAALKYLGFSYSSINPDEIRQAEELIIVHKKNFRTFADDNGQDLLASGEVDIAQEWNGDIAQVMLEDDDIALSIPEEGGLLWEDCLCIAKDAPHPENAHAFINYLLDAKVGASIADYIQYPTPNAAAKTLMKDEYVKNPAIFPDEETLARCETSFFLGVEGTRLYDEAWTRINAA